MMKHLYFLLFIGFTTHAAAQQPFSYKVVKQGSTPMFAVQSFADSTRAELLPDILKIERPRPATDAGFRRLKDSIDLLRKKAGKVLHKTGGVDPASIVPSNPAGFNGGYTNGIPNDNNVAISNSGAIISVLNTNITAFFENGDTIFKPKQLSLFAKPQQPLLRTYDPKVVYDPEADRFIVVFLNGAQSNDTRIIVAFSQTNNPKDAWNFYALPGNYLNDTSWLDYPIIGVNKQDLYITGNLLKDNTFWKDGFKQSVIWQVDKWKGYKGEPLVHNYFYDIRYNNKPIWNICAVQGGIELSDKEMYFLSVRPSDFANDTIFLHHISGTAQSGSSSINFKLLKTDKQYGVPPSAPQPASKFLETNDCRVLSAFIQDNVIHWVQTTHDHNKLSSGVYHGIISNISGTKQKVQGFVISSDTLDFGYPSIAYAGSSRNDQSAMITFSHVSSSTFPGTSAVMYYSDGTHSNVLRVKEGLNYIRWGNDTFVRWGDYTGIQRKYNEPAAFWLSGSFGGSLNEPRTWVAKVGNVSSPYVVSAIGNIYPNPTPGPFNAEFNAQESGPVSVNIYDVLGRKVLTYDFSYVLMGRNVFLINTEPLQAATYIVVISDQKGNKLYDGKMVKAY